MIIYAILWNPPTYWDEPLPGTIQGEAPQLCILLYNNHEYIIWILYIYIYIVISLYPANQTNSWHTLGRWPRGFMHFRVKCIGFRAFSPFLALPLARFWPSFLLLGIRVEWGRGWGGTSSTLFLFRSCWSFQLSDLVGGVKYLSGW